MRARRGLSAGSVLHQLRPSHKQSHLDLEELDRGLYRASHKHLWVPPGAPSVFGGQVLGQALHAAMLSVNRPDTLPISLHSYFLQRGQPQSDIIYQIRETSDLRSFFSRSVDAIQQGKIIFKLQAQFARTGEESLLAHSEPMPTGVPSPDSCPSMEDMLIHLRSRAPRAMHSLIDEALCIPIDVRYACGKMPDPLDPNPAPQPSRQVIRPGHESGTYYLYLSSACSPIPSLCLTSPWYEPYCW